MIYEAIWNRRGKTSAGTPVEVEVSMFFSEAPEQGPSARVLDELAVYELIAADRDERRQRSA